MKRPTIYDVAQRAGVSKSLVSLVLRDSPRVSAEKRDAVLAAVAELDYTPSRLAAGLAGTRTRSIGVLVDDFSNPWFIEALRGLRVALREDGYALSVADANLNAHLGIDPLDAFRSLRVDGIVLAGEASAAAVARSGIPAVVLGVRALDGVDLPVFASDERMGGASAARYLVEHQHRDIVCVSAPGASAAAREQGYVELMTEFGLEPRVIRAADTGEAAARAVTAEFFASNGIAAETAVSGTSGPGGPGAPAPRPTAIFAVNDPMAVGVIGAARDVGIAVPDGLSVVGYDDSPLAAYGLVALTTVSGDPAEVGEAAGRALVELIGGASAAAGSRSGQAFLPRLVVRGSTERYPELPRVPGI